MDKLKPNPRNHNADGVYALGNVSNRWMLVTNNYNAVLETSFTGNGDYTALNANQYRVILRTGFHNTYNENHQIIKKGCYDYHFWYQTYDGRWANKHGNGETELLPIGTTPFTSNSSGWSLPFTNSNYAYYDFYDGPIYSYIITVT